MTSNIVLIVILAVLSLLYIMRRRARLSRDDQD
jgi:hypothetical protein